MDINSLDFVERFDVHEAVVGIVGRTPSGMALAGYFEKHGTRVILFDRYESDPALLLDVVRDSHVVFVCSPSPVGGDGTRPAVPVADALSDIDRAAASLGRPLSSFVVCVVSPTDPGFVSRQRSAREGMRLVCAPELYGSSTKMDLGVVNRVVVGGDIVDVRVVLQFFLAAERRRVEEGKCLLVQCDTTEAELARLFVNGALFDRLSFSARMEDVCGRLGVSYENVRVLAALDPRVGPHATQPKKGEQAELEDDARAFGSLWVSFHS